MLAKGSDVGLLLGLLLAHFELHPLDVGWAQVGPLVVFLDVLVFGLLHAGCISLFAIVYQNPLILLHKMTLKSESLFHGQIR